MTQHFPLTEAGSLFLRANILHNPSASALLSTRFNPAAVVFFYRTQQFPGERGHGQDSEDHGSPAEPFHGVSVSHIHTLLYEWISGKKLYHRPQNAVSFLSALHYASDTLLTAGFCYPHTFRIHLLQRWLSRTLAGHLIKNVSRFIVGEARLISSPLAGWCNGV